MAENTNPPNDRTNDSSNSLPESTEVESLDDYIGGDIQRYNRLNQGTNYDFELAKQESWQTWFLNVLKALTSSSWSLLLAILLGWGILDNRLDIEREIENIHKATGLTDQEKIEYRLALRKEYYDTEKDILIPLITLVLGYYFGTKKND